MKKTRCKITPIENNPRTNNTTTKKRPIFSSVISFAHFHTTFLSCTFVTSWEQPFRRVYLKQTGTPNRFKSVLTKSLKYNFITNIFSAKTRFVGQQINKKRGATNFPTGNIKDSAKVASFLSLYIKTTRSSYLKEHLQLVSLHTISQKKYDSVVFLT